MEHITLCGVKYRVLPIPETKGQLKTSGAWNVGRSGIRPSYNPKILTSHLRGKSMLGSVSYGTDPVPRNS